MDSMARHLRFKESCSFSYNGQRIRGQFYPWKTPHKLEPDFVKSSGNDPELIRAFGAAYDSFDWWTQMKIRIQNKNAFQKKLDLQLFEAVGNADLEMEHFGIPDLDRVKQLVSSGATIDHFLHRDQGPRRPHGSVDQNGNPVELELSTLDFKNAIDSAVRNFTTEGFEVAKFLISSFPEYRHTFMIVSEELDADSLLSNAFYFYHVNLALFLLSIGKEKHPFYTFIPFAFEEDGFCRKPLLGISQGLGTFDFEEKIQILDAIRENYDFNEIFKTDYKMLKEEHFSELKSHLRNPDNPWRNPAALLIVKNLKILNQFCRMREIDPIQLFGESEYDWLNENIPGFEEDFEQ